MADKPSQIITNPHISLTWGLSKSKINFKKKLERRDCLHVFGPLLWGVNLNISLPLACVAVLLGNWQHSTQYNRRGSIPRISTRFNTPDILRPKIRASHNFSDSLLLSSMILVIIVAFLLDFNLRIILLCWFWLSYLLTNSSTPIRPYSSF